MPFFVKKLPKKLRQIDLIPNIVKVNVTMAQLGSILLVQLALTLKNYKYVATKHYSSWQWNGRIQVL